MFWQTQQVAEQRRVRILELERQHRLDLDRMDALAHERDIMDALYTPTPSCSFKAEEAE